MRGAAGRGSNFRAWEGRGWNGRAGPRLSDLISSMWRFGGRTGSSSSPKTRGSRFGASRRGGAGRWKDGRLGRSDCCGRPGRSRCSGFFHAGLSNLGLEVKGRPVPVLPVPTEPDLGAPVFGRSYADRSKLRPAGRAEPKLAWLPEPVLWGRSSSEWEKLRTGLGAEVRPAAGRKPSAPARSDRRGLSGPLLSYGRAGRLGRSAIFGR